MKYLNKEPFSFGWNRKIAENHDKIFHKKETKVNEKIGTKIKITCPECDGSKVDESGNKCITCRGEGKVEARVSKNQ